MTILSVRGLTKSFAGDAVIRGIDLDVEKGERIAILGASGSGKSTLLRCLNFMEMPDAGTVTLDGQPIGRRESDLTRVRQRIGMVFQQFNLFPHMTAVGNVMEGPRTVRRLSKADARARAERELARVGLADKAETYPAHLSGGPEAARCHRPRALPWIRRCCCSTNRLGPRSRVGRRGVDGDRVAG